LLRAVRPAATIEHHDARTLRHGGQYPRAFILHRTLWITPLATQAGRDLDQPQRKPMREPLAVFGETFRDPTWRALAHGDQARLHRSIPGCSGRFGCRIAMRMPGYVTAPQLFQHVEVAHARQHDVDDGIAQVHEHPFGLALAFNA